MQNWYDFWNIKPNCCSNPIMVAFLIYLTYSWIKIDKFRKHIFTNWNHCSRFITMANNLKCACACVSVFFLFYSTFLFSETEQILTLRKYISSQCGNILHYIAFDLCVNDFTIGRKKTNSNILSIKWINARKKSKQFA